MYLNHHLSSDLLHLYTDESIKNVKEIYICGKYIRKSDWRLDFKNHYLREKAPQ